MKHHKKLPIISLLALTISGFIAIITETLPAGLLPQISIGIEVSEAYAGQFITLYALGSVLSAVPVISWTRKLEQKTLTFTGSRGLFRFQFDHFFLAVVLPFIGRSFYGGSKRRYNLGIADRLYHTNG